MKTSFWHTYQAIEKNTQYNINEKKITVQHTILKLLLLS